MSKNIRNITILAHADAGKTTITENILFLTGKIKKTGNVDEGTSVSDNLQVERERGISVRSSVISVDWLDSTINLIDSPGHVDFSADVERVLRITDGAVLIISAVEGVQAHTETIFNALKERKIPTLIFINKIDRTGADCELVITEIRKELFSDLFVMQSVQNEGYTNAATNSFWSKTYQDKTLTEQLASVNQTFFEQFCSGIIPEFDKLNQFLKESVHHFQLIPVLFGSAKNSIGINELLYMVIQLLPAPEANDALPLSALVFAVDYDKTMGKISYIKIFNGTLSNRELIKNRTQNCEEKITSVRKIFASRFEEIQQAFAGNIVGVSGFQFAKPGDILGTPVNNIPDVVKLHSPLLTVQIKAVNEKDFQALVQAILELSNEDPALEPEWLRDEQELNLKIMGKIQMEILEQILEHRFNIKAKFEKPTVIYKETPASSGEGFVQYWMPKPCWAIMRFKIEPGEPGSGVVYENNVSVNKIQQKYQNEVIRTLPVALKQGIKGWEVTDIKITLIDGEDHEMHSRAGDFAIATPMGIMNGLVNTGTKLLEPILGFKIVADESLLGIISGDITQMRGNFKSPVFQNGKFVLTGEFPLATSQDYSVKLNSRSGGKAKFTTWFSCYKPCDDNQGIVRDYKGISPLDTAKYILKARKALQ